MEEQQLFLLCEDVLLEIFKHLGPKDMKNLSLTSKCGYDATKEYFEKRTRLVFSKAFSIQELQALTHSKRNYQEIVASVCMYDDIILQQLTYLNMKVSSVRLTVDYVTTLKDVGQRILYLKDKYKIKRVMIDSEHEIQSVEDIEDYKDENICTNDITSIRLSLNSLSDDFDEDFFQIFMKEFRSLETLDAYIDWPETANINIDGTLNIGTLTLSNDISGQLNILKSFKGVHTLIIEDCWDTDCLKNLIELNKNTLKTLILDLYRPGDEDAVIACQLKTLKVSADETNQVESLLTNQNELESLKLGVSFTRAFLEMLRKNCPPTLNIKRCNGFEEPIRKCIPDLPMVKHLIISHLDVIDFLPKTRNVETLKILITPHGGYRGFKSLNGFEFKYLTTIDIRCYDLDRGENELSDFSEVTMHLPKLEKIKCMHSNLALLKKYSNIKFFECGLCNFENIVDILKVLPKLEELEVLINAEDLVKVKNYFEFSDFGEYLKYVVITTHPNKNVDILKTLEVKKGDQLFSNQGTSDTVTVEIDIQNKQFMYKVFKQFE